MPARIYKPRNDATAEKLTIKRDTSQTLAKELLLPRIVERNQSALSVVPTPFLFFSKLPQGRRCACWQAYDSPQSDCKVCFGQGVVGGFERYGCQTEVFDVTHPKISLLNVLPDYASETAPSRFSLINTAVYGEIRGEIRIPQPNLGLNLLQLRMWEHQARNEEPGSIEAYCKTPSEEEYISLTREAIEARITSPSLQLLIKLSRPSPTACLPVFEQLRLRVSLIPEEKQVINVNLPREQEAYALEELGIVDMFGSVNFWLDNTLKRITTEDFFVSLRNNRRFKPVEVNPSQPHGILLSWDASCRFIREYENYLAVP